MRVIVCGGRDYADAATLVRVLDDLARAHSVEAVIEGNARGADQMAGFWARKRRIPNLKFNADWQRHGKAAGAIRNQEMLDKGKPDLVIAFPGGKGTADMVNRARVAGIGVIEVSARSGGR